MTEQTTICAGTNCPSRSNCKRYTERHAGATYAALWARRGAGDSACDQFLSSLPSTFEAKPFRGIE